MFCGWIVSPDGLIFHKEFNGHTTISDVLSYAYKCQKQYDKNGSFFGKVQQKYLESADPIEDNMNLDIYT